MAFDSLKALRDAGQPIDHLTEEQRAVLASLHEHEVRVLVSVFQRLGEAQGDVAAHDMKMM